VAPTEGHGACTQGKFGCGTLNGPDGFVAQTLLGTGFPLPRMDLAYVHGTGYAKSCEAVWDRSTDLDRCDLAIKVPRRGALTE
jgi:hypothetical protein